jgi:predicted phosphoadenosine phosphosulfate sulfurtransferase
MAIKKKELDIDVLTAARQRVKNAFSNGLPIHMSLSGGKDSIVLASVVYDMARIGEIDKTLLTVRFIDEEAMFDEVIEIVEEWRTKFVNIGVKFHWYCLEVKHYNCFNQLTNDESFICWDREKKDVWVREMPEFAITDHPMLKARVETYQDFLTRISANGITMTGVRISESIQRLQSMGRRKGVETIFPIFDWKDSDIWLYIKENNLSFPDVYKNMYQIGTRRNMMRISQFFSIDTAKVLVSLSEMYPDLMEKVTRREPNAYLAALYWDSELFRRVKGRKSSSTVVDENPKDYKKLVFEFMSNPENQQSRQLEMKRIRNLIYKFSYAFQEKHWKTAYGILVGGDPKLRSVRGLMNNIVADRDLPMVQASEREQ